MIGLTLFVVSFLGFSEAVGSASGNIIFVRNVLDGDVGAVRGASPGNMVLSICGGSFFERI